MFTGIVAELGQVVSVSNTDAARRLRIKAREVLTDAVEGCSIAVNGCCLTAIEFDREYFDAEITGETLDRTNLGRLGPGDVVNLERPVRADGRFDGHMVLGHVDGVGEIVQLPPDFRVRLPRDMMRYLVEKGSIAVDGISLTVFNLTESTFDVAIIPHTAAVTTLGHRAIGDLVNIELDILAKHVERLVNR